MKLKSWHTLGIAVVLGVLVSMPAPLLPPHGLAEWIQSTFKLGWKGSYLVGAVALHLLLYGSLGVTIGLSVPKVLGRRRGLLVLVPTLAVAMVVLIRSIKLGHVPVMTNAIIPIAACFFGVSLSLLFREQGWRATLVVTVVALGVLGWALLPGSSSSISQMTQAHLQRLITKTSLPAVGDERFAVLLQTAFAPLESASAEASVIEQNRAAILALGIAIGHERLARFSGLNREDDLIVKAAALRSGASLRGREDWARHFCLSAALAILENRFVSDAGGLMKEQLDALTHGSGFSFGDLAADRAGVRFAEKATSSGSDAKEMRARLKTGYVPDDFFPAFVDLPENLTVEQFRREFGGVGASRYREMIARIEALLDQCAALRSRSQK